MTQNITKSATVLQKGIYLGESMGLPAILDTILDFEKCPQLNKFIFEISFVTQILLQVKPGCFNLLMLSFVIVMMNFIHECHKNAS